MLPLVAYAGFDEGVEAYSRDNSKALASSSRWLSKGRRGRNISWDFCTAMAMASSNRATPVGKWFRKAAAQGDSRAQSYLGKMYEKGEGVERSLVDAHLWLSLSATSAPNIA